MPSEFTIEYGTEAERRCFEEASLLERAEQMDIKLRLPFLTIRQEREFALQVDAFVPDRRNPPLQGIGEAMLHKLQEVLGINAQWFSGKSILDVGSGIEDTFCSILAQCGIDTSHILRSDPHPQTRNFLKRTKRIDAVDVSLLAPIDEIQRNTGERSFDMITGASVFSIIQNLRNAVDICTQLLKEDGILCLLEEFWLFSIPPQILNEVGIFPVSRDQYRVRYINIWDGQRMRGRIIGFWNGKRMLSVQEVSRLYIQKKLQEGGFDVLFSDFFSASQNIERDINGKIFHLSMEIPRRSKAVLQTTGSIIIAKKRK